MGKRRSVGAVIGSILALVIGTALLGVPAVFSLFALGGAIRRAAHDGVVTAGVQGKIVFGLFFSAVFLGPTLYLLAKWPKEIRGSLSSLREEGPAAPRNPLIFRALRNGRKVRIRLPHTPWFSSVLLLTPLAIPLLIVGGILDHLECPGWLQIAVPLAIPLGFFYRAYRKSRRHRATAAFDLVIDQEARTLRIPAADLRKEPIVLPIAEAGSLTILKQEIAHGEGSSIFYSLMLMRPGLPELCIHQFSDDEDAEQLAQILCAETGIPIGNQTTPSKAAKVGVADA